MKKTATGIFTLVGSVTGAGFLSGRELITFFGAEGNFTGIAVFFFAMFFFLYFLLAAGKKYGGFKGFYDSLPRGAAKASSAVLYFSCFISLSGIYAGLYRIVKSRVATAFISLPVYLVCTGGISKIKKVSLFLTPVLTVTATAALALGGNLDFYGNEAFLCAPSAALYAGMNAFLCMPIACDLGGKTKAPPAVTAFFTAALLSALAIFILSAIKGSGSEGKELPSLAAAGYSPAYTAAYAAGCFMSFSAAYYPLINFFREKNRNTGCIVILTAAFLLSFFGLKNIVRYIYPAICFCGFTFLLSAALYELFFCKRDERVHAGGKEAKHRY